MHNASRNRRKIELKRGWVEGLEGSPMSIEPHEVVWARALSPRELDVALLVSQGTSNKEVARTLDIAEGTVKLHMHRVLRKLGATNRYALLLQARKNTEQSP
jgi:DNA-binding NarL/FixJ family response regulator